MNLHFKEIAEKTKSATCQPRIIKTQHDAAMVSGWALEIGLTAINAHPIASMMEWKRGQRLTLAEWIWQERKVVNDYLREVLKACGEKPEKRSRPCHFCLRNDWTHETWCPEHKSNK